VRSAVGVIVLALAGWLIVSVFVTPEAVAEIRPFHSSRQCQECHADVYAEWEQSWHAQAWTDPDVRTLSNDFSNTDCIDCHAPRPIFETGMGNRVLPRTTRRVEGVDCIACHLLPDGTMAGTVEVKSAPCRPVARTELVAPEFCAGCHDQHGTVQQWKASKYAQPGPDFQSCVDCHMPYRGGDPAKGREHRMHGGHDIELVRAAVELRGARDGTGWVVEVENVGAGHNYPTDERSRASDVFWRPLNEGGANGVDDWRHLYRFRNPYRYEVGEVDTELPAGETKRLQLDDPAAADGAEVILVYKLSPYYADPERPDPEREASVVHRIELKP
jgi:nitrate/TMAO reductase-like tetraheme cytochrome c subunit